MSFQIKKPRFTSKFARYRIEDPAKFKEGSFRTHDIGRKGHSKRIAGQLKGTGAWKTQAIIVTRADYKKGTRVAEKDGKAIILKGDGV
jgi:hypothetical protein